MNNYSEKWHKGWFDL